MTEGTNVGITCLHFKETPSLVVSGTFPRRATPGKADVENKPGRLRD